MGLFLQCFGETIVKAPGIPWMELRMPGRSPFAKNLGHRRGGNGSIVDASDNQVMSLLVIDFRILVHGDPAIIECPFLQQPLEGFIEALVEVFMETAGVFSCQAQQFANEQSIGTTDDPRTGND